MPIWVHRLLGTVLQIAGFFAGGIAGGGIGALILMAVTGTVKPPEGQTPEPGGFSSALVACCGLSIGAPLFFGGAWFGRTLGYGLFVRHVSARCSKCGGRTYLRSENANSVRYRCRSCMDVYVGRSWEE